MEASDAAEHVAEAGEGSADERFRSRVALAIAFMAMLLAITSLGGGNAAEDIMNNNIEASDTWAFYQAKTIRQTSTRLAADELELALQTQPALSPEAREAVLRKVNEYRQTADRYEDEPDPKDPRNPLAGEGRQQLRARALDLTAKRDVARRQDPNFDFAEALFQIAIVLASVAILANSRLVFKTSLAVGALAAVLMLNGYFLLLDLPL